MAVNWTYWPSDPTYSQTWDSWGWQQPWVTPSRPGTIRWAARLVTAPATEPAALADAKLHLRVDTPDDDPLIQNLIQSAREYIEARTGMALVSQTWVLQLDRFPRFDRVELWPAPGVPLGAILLPRNPVQSVSSIVWIDQNGASNTVDPSTYTVDLTSNPARIACTFNQSWPNVSSPGLAMMGGVQVTFVSGYASLAQIPSNLKTALHLMVGHWYINREEVAVDTRLVAIQIPVAADDLIGYSTPPMVG